MIGPLIHATRYGLTNCNLNSYSLSARGPFTFMWQGERVAPDGMHCVATWIPLLVTRHFGASLCFSQLSAKVALLFRDKLLIAVGIDERICLSPFSKEYFSSMLK